MAGRLPGVGLPARKRVHLLQQGVLYDKHVCRESYQKKRLDLASSPLATATIMDETAFKARQRLEQKLGYLDASLPSGDHHHSCRQCGCCCKSSHSAKAEGRQEKHSETHKSKKCGGFGIIQLGKSWLLPLGKHKKMSKDVCAICLEDFQNEQPTMDLPCSHKYHKACLLPWIADHPHCPYCRSSVQPSKSF